jgi:hypothetical protein
MLTGKSPLEATAIAKVTEALTNGDTPSLTEEEYGALPKGTKNVLGAGIVTAYTVEEAAEANRQRVIAGNLTPEEFAAQAAKFGLTDEAIAAFDKDADSKVTAAYVAKQKAARERSRLVTDERERQFQAAQARGYSPEDARKVADSLPEAALVPPAASGPGSRRVIDIPGAKN